MLPKPEFVLPKNEVAVEILDNLVWIAETTFSMIPFLMKLDAWNSYELLSRSQTVLAILIAALGALSLTVKIRADQVKKLNDLKRAAERTSLDAELTNKTEEARLLAEKLNTQLASRTIPKEKWREMGIIMDGAPILNVQLQYNTNGAEPAEFANQVAAFFGAIGLPFKDTGYVLVGRPWKGIAISHSNDERARQLSAALLEAFKCAGFDEIIVKVVDGEGILVFDVGLKP